MPHQLGFQTARINHIKSYCALHTARFACEPLCEAVKGKQKRQKGQRKQKCIAFFALFAFFASPIAQLSQVEI
jgi:hypothetical protein